MKLSAYLRDGARDLAALAGLGLTGYGAWLIYQPAGYLAVGILLLAGSVAGHLRGMAPRRKDPR